MADITLSTADTNGFIPQFWAQRALDVLRSNIVLANVVAKDINFTEAGWQGKSITVPYPGTFTTVAKAAGTPVTPQTPSGGQSVTLTLANHRVVPFLVEDFAAAQANLDLADRYIQPAAIAIAEQVEADLWMAAMQAGVIAPLGTAGTDLTSTVARTAMRRLNEAKAPMADRSLVLSPKDQAALLGDSSLASFFAFSEPQDIRNGFFGKLYGFDCYMSQLAPLGYTVTIGAATAGTFTLTFGGQTTSGIAYNASAATVQTALAGLSSIGAGNVSVSGPAGGVYAVTVNQSLAGTLTGSGSGLTGGSFAVAASQQNLATHKNALLYAVRPFAPVPPQAGVQVATANDPESGLSIRISAQYDVNNMGMRMNLDILYGTAVLRPNQAVIPVA